MWWFSLVSKLTKQWSLRNAPCPIDIWGRQRLQSDGPWFQLKLYHLIAVWPYVNVLILNFISCKRSRKIPHRCWRVKWDRRCLVRCLARGPCLVSVSSVPLTVPQFLTRIASPLHICFFLAVGLTIAIACVVPYWFFSTHRSFLPYEVRAASPQWDATSRCWNCHVVANARLTQHTRLCWTGFFWVYYISRSYGA